MTDLEKITKLIEHLEERVKRLDDKLLKHMNDILLSKINNKPIKDRKFKK